MRKILHIDLDAFFCAVEEKINPELAGKAFAVGGRPEGRGVVASCSYPAREFGVRSAMPTGKALRLCPHLMIVPSHYKSYSQYSHQMSDILNELAPMVEQISIDEAFLDVSDRPDPPFAIAKNLQSRINEELKLPCSLGAAANKLVAKIANDYGKSASIGGRPPNAITVVEPGKEAEFLAPLNVERLWGVGPKTAERLRQIGIQTIGELASTPERELIREFGKVGYDLSRHARGVDESPIVPWHEPKSISQETTFARDVSNPDELVSVLHSQVETVTKRLQNLHTSAATVKIKLRWPDFTTLTRQTTFEVPTDREDQILAAILNLFNKNWKPGKAVRLIGVGVSGLEASFRQLRLWDKPENLPATEDPNLKAAIDQLRERYGPAVIQRGSDHSRKT